jgi:hypothetical protein
MKVRDCNKRVLYIHIPKCGGCSVVESLGYEDVLGTHHVVDTIQPIGAISHATVHEYNTTEYDYIFTFIRNPFARAVSYFHWNKLMFSEYTSSNLRRLISDRHSSDHLDHIICKYNQTANTYECFKDWVTAGIPGFRENTINLYIDDSVKVFKIENTQSWPCLLQELNIINSDKLKLQHTNQSSCDIYTSYYDNKTRMLMGYFFRNDIEMFNYKFGD